MEDGVVTASEEGTPQGAVISPLLANIYLHYVFDLWAEQWRRRHARGDMIIVRYADDIVVGFEHRERRRAVPGATARDGWDSSALALHPDKTRLIEFGRFAAANRERRGLGKPETFDFLGFTHICAQDRQGGFFAQAQEPARPACGPSCRRSRRSSRRRQARRDRSRAGHWLRQVVSGFFNYHAVPTNSPRARRRSATTSSMLWRRALRRRSQTGPRPHGHGCTGSPHRWLPQTAYPHPWPIVRFAVNHPRWEPGAVIGHAGFCAGGAR